MRDWYPKCIVWKGKFVTVKKFKGITYFLLSSTIQFQLELPAGIYKYPVVTYLSGKSNHNTLVLLHVPPGFEIKCVETPFWIRLPFTLAPLLQNNFGCFCEFVNVNTRKTNFNVIGDMFPDKCAPEYMPTFRLRFLLSWYRIHFVKGLWCAHHSAIAFMSEICYRISIYLPT